MLPINLADLVPADIQRVIDSEVAESITLEYKEALPAGGTDEKREFLYDIAAMANQVGGDIIYGLVDRRGEDSQATGIAERLAGMKISNSQTEIARLSNLIRDGIAPRLAGITMQHLTCPDGEVLVIRIPRSWNKPHMVIFNGVNKFFGRGATGKNPMSVDEIGRAFSEQGELYEAIKSWRSHRAILAERNEGPIQLAGAVTMLFHAIPASAFTRELLRESWTVSEYDKQQMYVPHIATNHRFNADGFLYTAQLGEGSKAFGYTQLFRSGIIEYADSQCFGPIGGGSSYMIYGQELEKQMLQCYQNAITRFRKIGQSGPLYVGFSLVGLEKRSFYSTMRRLVFAGNFTIKQNVFTSPEVFVDINDVEARPYSATLLPLVDTMWQVAGFEGTPFKNNGAWDPFRDY